MAQRYGVDTSILVRLVARQPQADYERCLNRLGVLAGELEYAHLAMCFLTYSRLNCPPGGVDSPLRPSPQHSTIPSALNPQLCVHPALTERNCPPGGVDSP